MKFLIFICAIVGVLSLGSSGAFGLRPECDANEERVSLAYSIPVPGNNQPDPGQLPSVISEELILKNKTEVLKDFSDETAASAVHFLFDNATYVSFHDFQNNLFKTLDEFIDARAGLGRKIIFLVSSKAADKSDTWTFNLVRSRLEEAKALGRIDYDLVDIPSALAELRSGTLTFENTEFAAADDAAFAGTQISSIVSGFSDQATESHSQLHFSVIVPYWADFARGRMATISASGPGSPSGIDLWIPQTSYVKIGSFEQIRNRATVDVKNYLMLRFRYKGGTQEHKGLFAFAHKLADPGSVLTEPSDQTQYWIKLVRPGNLRPPPYKKKDGGN